MADQTTIHLDQYSSDARTMISNAQSLADTNKHATVEPLHLLSRMLEQKDIAALFQKMGVDIASFARSVDVALDRLPKRNSDLAYLSASMLDLLKRAEKEGNGSVSVQHLLNALVQEVRGPASQLFQQFSISPGAFRASSPALPSSTLGGSSFTQDLLLKARKGEVGPIIGRDDDVRRLLQILGRKTQNSPILVGELGVGKTTVVEECARRFINGEVPATLSNMAFVELELSALVSGVRSKGEIEERVKNLLNGFKQEGKSAILLIDGIENLINQNPSLNVSDLFKTLVARDEVRIIGTTTSDGLRKMTEKDASFARRFTVLNVEAPTPDQAIEVIRGIAYKFEKYHNVVISDTAIRSAVSLAKRYLQERCLPDSAISVVDAACSTKRLEITGMPAELDRDIQRLNSLKAQQSKLLNDSDQTSAKMLDRINGEIGMLEPKVLSVQHSMQSRRSSVEERNMLRGQYQKAQEDLERAREQQNYSRVGQLEHGVLPSLKQRLEAIEALVDGVGFEEVSNVVGENEVAEVVGKLTGIPVNKMMEDETEKLMKMEDRLSQRVLGQDEIIKAVSRAVRRSRVGLRNAKQPIGSFLFLGSSGTGKTETAKALAEFLFDDEGAMTRFDMSEFQSSHMVARLIGAPVGYQGAEKSGELIVAIRKHPYSVLLFDEIEKAHPDIFNILLAMLEDGRVSSATGETVDCSNTVIILTSNLGSRKILDADESMFLTPEGQEQMKDMLLDEVKGFLRPEFINRINDLMVFRPLSKSVLRGIIDIEIRKVEKMIEERGLKLVLSEKAKTALVDEGFDGAYGARPLKRSLIKRVQDPLVEKMLSSQLKDNSTVQIDFDNNQFTFT